MNKNENILIKDINEIKDEIQKSLKNINYIKELHDKSDNDNYEDEPKNKIKTKSKRKNLHIVYFIPILQFLDIKSLIELSKINHLFFSFIYSYYFYCSAEQIRKYSNKNLNTKKDDIFNKKNIERFNKNKSNNKNQAEEENLILGPTKKIYSNFMSALTGALSYIAPIQEMPNAHKEKNELEEIEKKINIHEKLLNDRIKQLAISNEIKDTKAEIDKYIKEQYDMKKIQKKNEIKNKNNYNNNKINDQTIKKLKREKYESEYKNLMKEINEYESQYIKLKKENELQNRLDIDLETKMIKIRYYVKNNFKFEKNP